MGKIYMIGSQKGWTYVNTLDKESRKIMLFF